MSFFGLECEGRSDLGGVLLREMEGVGELFVIEGIHVETRMGH